MENLFTNLSEIRLKEKKVFASMVEYIAKGCCPVAPKEEVPAHLSAIIVKPMGDKSSMKQISFELNHEAGAVAVTFALPVDNRDTPWALVDESYTSEVTWKFDKFTEKTKMELRALVEKYVSED